MANRKTTNSKQYTKGNKDVTGPKKKSRFERRKVFELRAKIDGLIKTKHKLTAIFNDSQELEKGYSDKELSATLRPNDVDVNGIPTCEGRIKTKRMIRRWRKRILEEGKAKGMVIVPFAEKHEHDGWLYYNMQEREEFATIEKQVDDVILGLEKLLRGFIKLVSMRKEEKNERNEEAMQEIQRILLVLKRAKRRI